MQVKEGRDEENAKEIRANQCNLVNENEAIADLQAFYEAVTKNWSDTNFHHNIGHVQYAAAITVDVEGGTLYTSDWAAFLAAEAKVRDEFEGNVVDLGAFRLIFLIFTSSNENNLIQDLIFSSSTYGDVLSSGWWYDHVQVSRGEKAQGRGLRHKRAPRQPRRVRQRRPALPYRR